MIRWRPFDYDSSEQWKVVFGMRISRLAAVAMLAAGATILVLSTVGLAQTDPPDTDYDLAASKFGGNEECPQGEAFVKGEWEDVAVVVDNIPDGLDYGSTPPIDIVWVSPSDSSPFIDKVPQGATFLIACAAIAPNDLKLVDGDGVILAP